MPRCAYVTDHLALIQFRLYRAFLSSKPQDQLLSCPNCQLADIINIADNTSPISHMAYKQEGKKKKTMPLLEATQNIVKPSMPPTVVVSCTDSV